MTAHRLPAATRVMVAGSALSSLGTGLVLPLTLIYLHQVRRIPLPEVGALLTMSAAVGLVAVPLSGVLVDRFGARRVLCVVLAGQAVADASLAWVHSAPAAIGPLLLVGATLGPFFPTFITMLAAATPQPAVQQRAFALNFTAVNAGIGVGAAVGAAVADVRHPGTFGLLFVANGLSCALFAALLTRVPNVVARREPHERKAGYRDVLAHRQLRAVMIATFVLAFTGYAALDSGLPAYATVEAHVSPRVVALSLTVNTVVIVAAQLAVLKVIRGVRRSRALAGVGLVWAVSWAVFGLSAWPAAPAARVACVMAFTALFGLGETVMAPTVAPLLNSLAGERIRGRANALSSAGYSIAFVASPAICTQLIAAGAAAVWICLLCAGCFGVVVLALGLGRQLSPAQDRVEEAAGAEPERALARDER